MIAIIIPIESEGSSFFNQSIRYVSPIQTRDILTQKISKILKRPYEIKSTKE